jgi:hypothetical protein
VGDFLHLDKHDMTKLFVYHKAWYYQVGTEGLNAASNRIDRCHQRVVQHPIESTAATKVTARGLKGGSQRGCRKAVHSEGVETLYFFFVKPVAV